MVMRLLLRVSVTRDGGRSNSMGLILDARNVHTHTTLFGSARVGAAARLVEQAGFPSATGPYDEIHEIESSTEVV
ncbi:hypothetical protein M3J09_009912 [Ascochyta lentis]